MAPPGHPVELLLIVCHGIQCLCPYSKLICKVCNIYNPAFLHSLNNSSLSTTTVVCMLATNYNIIDNILVTFNSLVVIP